MAAGKIAIMGVAMCVLLVLAQGENRPPYPNCKSACYLECMQMRLFTWSECKRICKEACEIAPSPMVDDGFNPEEEMVSSSCEEIRSIDSKKLQ